MGCGGSKPTAVAENSSQKDQQSSDNNNTAKTTAAKTPSKTASTKHDSPRGKYVVNNSANGSSERSESGFSEATDRGFKRRIREKLKDATAGSDLEGLDKAMDRFINHNLEDCGDLTRAQERYEFLRLRRDLRDAVRRSHVGVLKKTIEEAENSQFSGQLQNQIEGARKKLQHLQELNEYKHDILNMEQATISEIHSYQRPPMCVHDVMVATYLLLGHSEPRLREWGDIQMLLCHVGRDSLIHEIRDFDSANVDESTNRRVQEILHPHELHAIRQASNGAATFYVWTTQICDKVERDSSEEQQRQQEDQGDKARTGGHNDTDGKNSSPRKKKKG